MSTVHLNPVDRDAAADAAERRFFPDSFKQEALRSDDQDLIFEVLDNSSVSSSTCDVMGFARAVRSMTTQP